MYEQYQHVIIALCTFFKKTLKSSLFFFSIVGWRLVKGQFSKDSSEQGKQISQTLNLPTITQFSFDYKTPLTVKWPSLFPEQCLPLYLVTISVQILNKVLIITKNLNLLSVFYC